MQASRAFCSLLKKGKKGQEGRKVCYEFRRPDHSKDRYSALNKGLSSTKQRKQNKNPDVVTGTFFPNDYSAAVLFDSGADRSYVSLEFRPKINKKSQKLKEEHIIEYSNGELVRLTSRHLPPPRSASPASSSSTIGIANVFLLHNRHRRHLVPLPCAPKLQWRRCLLFNWLPECHRRHLAVVPCRPPPSAFILQLFSSSPVFNDAALLLRHVHRWSAQVLRWSAPVLRRSAPLLRPECTGVAPECTRVAPECTCVAPECTCVYTEVHRCCTGI
ncbi:hypothetical protein OSB04_016668 [Centaurea solstitialis]|uniref:Uncharacterized protein n=1 Tax=Centaurea solstitialis TaxID=347529 RepID=A0AA38TLF0_9ASTR|nr:hypothetical protein OSB04_016668 [Centaurea solstitialis]